MTANRLARRHPRRIDVPLLAVAALVLLLYSIFVPAVTFDGLFGDRSFSVWGGIVGFFEAGSPLLGLLLVGFSVAFPIAKLSTILFVWFAELPPPRRARFTGRLELLGKWSLLDAFVIGALIGTVQLGILTVARPELGAYLYLTAIVLSLVATAVLRPFTTDGHERHLPDDLGRRGLVVTLPSAALFAAGIALPLLNVEKGFFWSSSFSLLSGTFEMLVQQSAVLALAIFVFVIVLPAARLVALIALRLRAGGHAALARLARTIDLWSMADVFVLAILVVFSKIGNLASAEPRAGMWCLIASSVLGSIDSYVLQTRAHRQR